MRKALRKSNMCRARRLFAHINLCQKCIRFYGYVCNINIIFIKKEDNEG